MSAPQQNSPASLLTGQMGVGVKHQQFSPIITFYIYIYIGVLVAENIKNVAKMLNFGAISYEMACFTAKHHTFNPYYLTRQSNI